MENPLTSISTETPDQSTIRTLIKITSTALMLSAIALILWQVIAPLPPALQALASFVQVIALIHTIEGVIAAIFILRDRLRTSDQPVSDQPVSDQPTSTLLAVIQGALYTFFVGTIGLSEILTASAVESPNDAEPMS